MEKRNELYLIVNQLGLARNQLALHELSEPTAITIKGVNEAFYKKDEILTPEQLLLHNHEEGRYMVGKEHAIIRYAPSTRTITYMPLFKEEEHIMATSQLERTFFHPIKGKRKTTIETLLPDCLSDFPISTQKERTWINLGLYNLHISQEPEVTQLKEKLGIN